MPLRSEIFGQDGYVDPNSELQQRAKREADYGAMYEQALGTLKPPEMGAKYMQGPEGKLWQGIEQQQAFGAAQAGRRGFNPFAARGAAQSGAELGSQGYGAAAGIREQQEAFRRKAELALLQQRTAQDFAQGGIETGQLGAKLGQQAFETAQRQQLDAEAQSRKNQAFEAGLGAFTDLAGKVATVASDERMKENIMPAGSRADALMELLGSASPTAGMSREDAKKYYNTPAGGSADDAQMMGEFGNRYNPRTATVYTGQRARRRAPDGDDGDALLARLLSEADASEEQDDGGDALLTRLLSEADEPDAARPASRAELMAPMRGVMIAPNGEGGPDNAIGYGTTVPSRAPTAGRGGVVMPPLEVRSQMTPERRRRAEEALGIPQRIDPRAADYVASQMPRASAFLTGGSAADIAGRAVRRADGVIEMPTQYLQETAEDALRRREANRRAAIMLQSLNSGAAADEAKAARPAAAKGAELADMMDEYASQYSKKLGGKIMDNALDNTVPYLFSYKPGMGQQPGEQLGTMAQDLQQNPVTNSMVTPTPRGLAINPTKVVAPLMSMVGRLNERVKKVERR